MAEGLTLRAGGTRFRIDKLRDDGFADLTHLQTGERKELGIGSLLAQIGNGVDVEDDGTQLIPPTATDGERSVIAMVPLDMQSHATNRDLIARLRWIEGLKKMGYDARCDEDEIAQALVALDRDVPNEIRRFSARTIKEHFLRYEKADDARVLTPRYIDRGGRGKPRILGKAEELLQERIAAERKKTDRLRPIDLHEGHVHDVNLHNSQPGVVQIVPASESTVRRRFREAFDAFDISVRNVGRKKTLRAFRTAGVRIRADEPLLAAQFDDTDGEVYLIDEISGMPWGRANITMGIDENTRSILGKEISEYHRDTWAATSAMVNAVMPKDMSLPEYSECQRPWYAYGKLGEVQMDNALWYRTPKLVEGAIADAGSIPCWSKPRAPTGKTDIEHLNHIFKTDYTPTLPGWRGPKRDRDGLEEGPGTAVLDRLKYIRLANRWMTDRYPYMPQEDGLCAWDRWSRFFKGRQPVMPMDTQAFRLIATLRETLTLRDSGGLLRMGLRYQSAGLDELRRKLGPSAKISLRIHPRDLSRMYVWHPQLNVFITVPCVEENLDNYLSGLTHYQQRLILAKCRESGLKNPNFKDCVAAKEAIRQDVRQLRGSHRMRDRRRAYRAATDDAGEAAAPAQQMHAPGSDGRAPYPAPAPARPTHAAAGSDTYVISDLEARMRELEELDLSDNDPEFQEAQRQ